MGPGTVNVCPHSHYPTKDGKWIAIACTSDKIFTRLAEAQGQPAHRAVKNIRRHHLIIVAIMNSRGRKCFYVQHGVGVPGQARVAGRIDGVNGLVGSRRDERDIHSLGGDAGVEIADVQHPRGGRHIGRRVVADDLRLALAGGLVRRADAGLVMAYIEVKCIGRI